MPNWCYNELSVEIDTEYVNNIYNSVKDVFQKYLNLSENENNAYTLSVISNLLNPLDFNNFKNLDETNYIKLFVDECKLYAICRSNNDYNYSGNMCFESAWGPPIDSLEEISEYFKLISIYINYEEIGGDLGGEITISNGEIIEENEWILSEKNWEDYGGSHVAEVLIKYLINEDIIIKNDNLIVNFKKEEDIIDFCKNNDDPFSIIEPFIIDYIYDYAYNFDLENCEDKIFNEFRKYINNKINKLT